MSNIIKRQASQTALEDKHGGMPTFPIVDALEELSLVASQAQLKRLMEQHQVIGSLSVQFDAVRKEKASQQAKVNQMQELMKLKETKRTVRKIERAIEQAVNMLNGSYVTLLADFMPGKPILEKLQAIESEMLSRNKNQKQLGK